MPSECRDIVSVALLATRHLPVVFPYLILHPRYFVPIVSVQLDLLKPAACSRGYSRSIFSLNSQIPAIDMVYMPARPASSASSFDQTKSVPKWIAAESH
jgi:hypothetical protein